MASDENMIQTFRAIYILSILAYTVCHTDTKQREMIDDPYGDIQAQTALSHNDNLSSNTDKSWKGIDFQETGDESRRGTALGTVSSEAGLTRPCKYLFHQDSNVVDCSSLGLTKLNPRWFPLNTTTLLLDHNSLNRIPNATFSHLVYLRLLRLSHNKISRIQPNAFKGLENVEILDLENNCLLFSDTSYPTGIFKPLKRLKQLHLKNNAFSRAYPDQLFSGLENLEYLSLDTAGDEVQLGEQFATLPNLFKLELTGKTKIISNTSFVNVKQLRFLFIHHCLLITNFSHSALGPLPNLEVLILDHVLIGVNEALHILKPLSLRGPTFQMKIISFAYIYRSKLESVTDLDDGSAVLDGSNTEYFRNICVEKIALVGSHILIVRRAAIISEVWKSCLKVVDLSVNPLIVAWMFTLSINSLPNLEEIIVIKFRGGYPPVYTPPFLNETQNDQWMQGLNHDIPETTQSSKPSPLGRKNIKGAISGESKNVSFVSETNSPYSGVIARLPDSLKVMQLSGRTDWLYMYNSFYIHAQSLTVLNVSDCGLIYFTGVVTGFTNLQTIDASGNDMSLLSESFLDPFTGLMDLRVANCKLDPNFMFLRGARVFGKLHALQRLDLASNSLSLLQHGIFSTNTNLKNLGLAGNKFKEIPFELENTPHLQVLDLSGNSITTLKPDITEQLDNLGKQNNKFTLFLGKNVLSCACDNLLFLQWLQTTAVTLDNGGNYTCIDEGGQLSHTADYDIQSVWRKCFGKVYLSISIILLFIMIIGFLVFFVIWKNSTFIITRIMHQFIPLKKAEDYGINVFIGYSERDYRFARLELNEYIEGTLHLRTYLHQRDMPAIGYFATNILDAINNSWRIVLLVTENFLQGDQWSSVICAAAVSSLDWTNPSRVVVLVEERLRHLLPRDLVTAVPEDNIMVMSGMQLNYEIKETLRTRLVRG